MFRDTGMPAASIREIVHKVSTFLEMIKFEHSIFALPFAYLGLFLAEGGWPRVPIFFWVTIAMVTFRTYGMSVNRIIDCKIDGQNPRTQARALPTGKLSIRFAAGTALLSLLVFEISAYQLSLLCFRLSWVPVFLASLYPWMKRFTWLSHFVLGIILGIAPYGAWIASRGDLSWIPACFMIGVACWVAGFDIVYALQDLHFDREHRLYSFPARFGQEKSLQVTRLLHAAAVAAWLMAGWLSEMGIVYYLSLGLAGFFLIRENWLIRSFGLNRLQEAFFKMNAIVSITLFAAVCFDISLRGFFT